MSSCSTPCRSLRPARRILARLLLGAALLAPAGCGFHPLYAEPSSKTEVAVDDRLAAVQILPLRDRTGQQMHNFLRDRLNPSGQPLHPSYLLEVRLREWRQNLGIRLDETATRANLMVIASFVLRAAGSGAVLYKSDARSTNSFNILTSQFATDVAENDARKRGLREVADSIRTRLAIYFSRQDSGQI